MVCKRLIRDHWDGKPGHVVFVLGSSTFPADWPDSIDWYAENDREGFTLDTEVAGLVFKHESDEDLEFVGRMK